MGQLLFMVSIVLSMSCMKGYSPSCGPMSSEAVLGLVSLGSASVWALSTLAGSGSWVAYLGEGDSESLLNTRD